MLAMQAQPLPKDPTIRTGKLKNGMTYYIRHNAKEAGLADFYIAQRVGSILEEPRQRGLAHFLEHMAFNGTKNFPGKGKRLGIVPWCETIGVKFGANLNAYTSSDQTVYHIGSAPLKREGIIDSCLAVQRLQEQAMPKVYKGTKYEDCLPIGSMDIVDNFAYQDLRDYYHKWYRPDLQAIIVVGDIDVDKMEKKIKKTFSSIPMPKGAAERIYYTVDDNEKMIIDIEKDKEQPIALCHIYQKREATPDSEKNTEKYLRDGYIDALISAMLNDRLAELRQLPVPPFQSATSRASQFFLSRTKDAFSLSISCKQDNILGGIVSAVAAAERARQHFLEGEPLLSVDYKLEIAKKLDREVTLADLNAAVKELITDKNQVVVMYAPDKEGFEIPTEKQLEQIILAAQQQDYAPYEEAELAESLISSMPKAGTIVSEQPWRHGFTELTLSNGMKVYTKKTDYEADAVSLRMQADGGTSQYGDEDIPNFALISSGITEAGIGTFDAVTLRKMLTGKSVRVSPSVGSKGQSISGSASLKDMEVMFQLAYLYFTQPRKDTAAFASLMSRQRAFLANRNASPKVDYNDSIRAILYGHHPRMEPVVQQTLDKVSYDRILEIYKERFSDAANFKTVIIGNFDEQELRRLLCQYLAPLPATNKHEQTNYSRIPQIVGGEKLVKFSKPQATPLANVSIFLTADVPFTPQSDLELDFLRRCLSIAYTDSVREEKGGTYGVSVAFDLDKDDHPNTTLKISYNADPNRYEELNPIVYQQLKNIAENGPAASSMQKVKEYLIKQYAQVAITNDYWSYIIWHELDDDADFDRDYCQMVEQMTPAAVQRMARQLLDAKRCIEVTMLSE